MRQKRVPNRVHVVRPPQDDQQSSAHNVQIVRMLAQISDKLKRSEAERYELLGELREYRKSLKELEDSVDFAKKSSTSIENKIQSRDQREAEVFQRQARFERAIKDTEEKLVKSAASQAILDKKLKETTEKQIGIDQRLDESVSEQTRLNRQLEIISEDKSRVARKIERLEEIVLETQDALRAKAMVLLTDQSNAAKAALAAPAWSKGDEISNNKDEQTSFLLANFLNFKTLGVASMVIAAMLSGWAISQMQQPEVPQIAILDGGDMVRLNLDDNKWEPLITNKTSNKSIEKSGEISDLNKVEAQKLSNRLSQDSNVKSTPVSSGSEVEKNVLNYSDEQLLEALEKNPEKLGEKLNAIEPSSNNATKSISLDNEPSVTKPMKDFEKQAFAQDPKIASEMARSKGTSALSDRMSPDASLPNSVREVEKQAFAGIAEAQHDLGAIYTAGHGGVKQNFEKASFWFREAADSGIANAQYNLGVLYHQGLGVDKNLDKALYWYREAAKLHHPEAEYNLGIAYIEGIGVEYNAGMAAEFFERAANSGIMEAAYNLGLIYENGLLGEAKPDEALLWYKIAADQGSPDAKTALDQLAESLQIDMNDVDKLVERMQKINQSVKGRRAGPIAKSSDTNQSSSASGSVNAKQALVAQIQEYLMLTNYYPGPADGITGPQTVDAIRAYQIEKGLQADGKPTQKLLAHMVSGAIKTLNR